MNDATPAPASKKAAICAKSFLLPSGEKSKRVTADAVAVVFSFANGNDHAVEITSFPEPIRAILALHGASQKLGDEYAGADDPAKAEEDFLSLLERLQSGVWSEVKGEAGPRVTIVAQALQRVKPDKYATIEAAEAEVKSWSAEVRKAKLAVPQLDAAIAQIRAENAAKSAADKAAKAAQAEAADL